MFTPHAVTSVSLLSMSGCMKALTTRSVHYLEPMMSEL